MLLAHLSVPPARVSPGAGLSQYLREKRANLQGAGSSLGGKGEKTEFGTRQEEIWSMHPKSSGAGPGIRLLPPFSFHSIKADSFAGKETLSPF